MTTESVLIQKSKDGDPNAFGQLIRRYEEKIFNLAHHVCSTAPAEADDIYQETFLTAFKKIRQFRERSQLGTWLYRIAANLCWMRLRKKKREPFVPFLDLPHHHDHAPHPGAVHDATGNPEDDPLKRAKKKELQEKVGLVLAELPVDYRLVVTMKDIQGMKNEEIAKIMKLSLPAVKSRLHRGRLYLRDRLTALFSES